MGNMNVKSDEGKRKKVLKKAALLATVASITSAATITHQKPKESEAIIGAIIGIVTTVIGVGSGIAQTVVQTEAEKKAKKEAEEEARRQAEQERIQHLLETSSEHNVRLENNDDNSSTPGKEINISIADNSNLSDGQDTSAVRNSGGLQKPSSPPKGIYVGGFGDTEEESDDEVVQQSVIQENNSQKVEEVKEESTNNNVSEPQKDININVNKESEEKKQEISKNETIDKNTQNNENKDESKNQTINRKPLNNTTITNTNKKPLSNTNNSSKAPVIDLSGTSVSDIPSNLIKFDITEDEDDGVIYEEIIINGSRSLANKIDNIKVEVDESMLMDLDEAENHVLVQEGILSSEDLVLLDFGIRNGSITDEILSIMHDNGDITDEYYEGAMILFNEIQEELESVY